MVQLKRGQVRKFPATGVARRPRTRAQRVGTSPWEIVVEPPRPAGPTSVRRSSPVAGVRRNCLRVRALELAAAPSTVGVARAAEL